MRIMQLTTDLRYSGAEHVIADLARELRGRGHDCAVAGLFQGGRAQGRLRSRLQEQDFPVFYAGMERKWMLWKLLGLRRFVRAWRPDVLHCHLFHANVAGALIGADCPLIWTHHNLAGHQPRLRRLVYRALWRAPDCHVFVSEAARRSHAPLGEARRSAVIHDGIALEAYLRVVPRPGRVFGSVGRLIAGKGFDMLVRAFALLCSDEPEARLLLAGRGPAEREVRRLAAALGVADRVEMVGYVDDVPEFLSRLSAFVNPSLSEGFGLTLLEALAAGLPCIAVRLDALAEVGGEVVAWVQPGDAEGLCEAMRRVDESALAPGATAARRARASQFSAARMAERCLELYESLGQAP